MNLEHDDDPSLEQELRSLTPSRVSDETLARWQESCGTGTADYSDRPPYPMSRAMLLLAALVVLTGFLGIFWVQQAWRTAQPDQPVAASESRGLREAEWIDVGRTPLRPAALNSQFLEVLDEGVVAVVGEVPFRRVRYRLLDTYRWAATTDAVSMEMQVPREEILLLPVVTY